MLNQTFNLSTAELGRLAVLSIQREHQLFRDELERLHDSFSVRATKGEENEMTISDGMSWGDWKLDAKRLALTYDVTNNYYYEIDLEHVNRSEAMLDWIFQIRRKAWATDATVAQLVSAFQDIFEPQATLCSYGLMGANEGKKIDPAELIDRRLNGLDPYEEVNA